MAKIWPVYEGKDATPGWPWAEISLPDAARLFGIQPADFVAGLDATPRFGRVDRDLSHFGYRHVIVEVAEAEARKAKWRPGFYRARVSPKDAFNLLIKHAVATALGDENVIRVDNAPATDSRGEDALRVTVVIAPNAIDRMASDAALNALVGVTERLREMRDKRTPIIEYATEAELAQDVGH